MINAKTELLYFLKNRGFTPQDLKAAEVIGGWRREDRPIACLGEAYGEGAVEAFVSALDFTYDEGYGGQELFGTLWFNDGTWAERGEYDGSEWWEHRKAPEVPAYLKQTKAI